MSDKLKFTGTYQEMKDSLDGVVFYGVNGAPPVLVDIKHGVDSKDDCDVVEFVFNVASYKRPHADAVEPIESREMSVSWKQKGNNAEWTIRAINDGLGLKGDEQLIDDGDSWIRLVAADEPKSLVGLIGKPTKSLLVKTTVKQKGENEGTVYYNLFSPPARESAKDGKISAASIRRRKNGGGDDDTPTDFAAK